MFERIKAAGRKGKIEHDVRRLLQEAGVADQAQITLRDQEGQLRATVLLAESADFTGEDSRALETRLNQIDGLAGATLVTTRHKTAPTSERIKSGHDNPLALPGQKKGAADAGARARPQKQRPGNAARVIAVASGKGGVGKSTIAAHLAMSLAARGEQVGLLDLDIYGPSLPILFGLTGTRPKVEDGMAIPLTAAGLSLMSIGFLVGEEQALAWRGPMVMGAAKQLLDEVRWPELDWLIIDTPPGTGDAHITLMQRTRIDGAIIVTTPSPLAVADVRRGAALFRKMDTPILGLVENMSQLPDGQRPFGNGLSEQDLKALSLERLAQLPLSPELGQLIGTMDGPAASASFTALTDQLLQHFSHLDPAAK